jgi:hypothetical protein
MPDVNLRFFGLGTRASGFHCEIRSVPEGTTIEEVWGISAPRPMSMISWNAWTKDRFPSCSMASSPVGQRGCKLS